MTKKLVVKVNGNPYEVEVGNLNDSPVTVTVNGNEYEIEFEENAAPVAKPVKKATPAAAPAPVAAAPAAAPAGASSNTITAPMPGKIMDIKVKAGDKVSEGQQVCALEAMKMKNIIRSSRAGTVASVEVSDGQKVAFGTVIIRFA